MAAVRRKGARAYVSLTKSEMSEKVEIYAPLVKRIALHLKARLPANVEVDDLIQAGMIGLMDAISHYEQGLGATFETYASIRIRGSMIDELRAFDWVPRSVYQNGKLISNAIHKLTSSLGREPKETEIAQELGVSLNKYHQMLQDSASSQLIGFEDLGVTDDVISENAQNHYEDKPFSYLSSLEFKKALANAIKEIPEREQMVLSLYYNEELNLKEIGKVLTISESRACQLMSQAMGRLRSILKDWNNKE